MKLDGNYNILTSMSMVHIIFVDKCVKIIPPEEQKRLTLNDCYMIAVLNGYTEGVITVMEEAPLEGQIYRYGNHGPYWEKIGSIVGYA